MHGELPGLTDVAGGVLEAHVGIVLDADGDDRRIMSQDVEETEGAGIRLTIFADGCHERNRTGNDSADQDLVAFTLGQFGEVEMGMAKGGIDHVRPRLQCGGFQAGCGATGSRIRPW